MADAGKYRFFWRQTLPSPKPQKNAIEIPTYGKMRIAFHLYKTNT
jgi:hypothetical protein